MEPAEQIRQSVDAVMRLRAEHAQNPALAQAVLQVKTLQTRRFRGTYADMLAGGPYTSAARFFLQELYGTGDASQRDAQFSRIAGTLQRVFPSQVVTTAVNLALLHSLTESLDHAMGVAWLAAGEVADVPRYVSAWHAVGMRERRQAQLDGVMALGRELERITRLPGLRMMLRMMRKPASAAGMGALQAFLESGFDTFADMARRPQGVGNFLQIVNKRETAFIDAMFAPDAVACETALTATLGEAR